MNFPNNISKNTIQVYHIGDEEFKPTKRILSIDLNQWNSNIPKSLKYWSIQAICNNWAENPLINELPLLSDIMSLLDILPTDLPLDLTVNNIIYDCYWLRCYKSRWPNRPPLGRNFSEVENLLQAGEDMRNVLSSPQNNESTQASNHNTSKTTSQKSAGTNSINSCENFAKINGENKSWKELYLEMHIREYLENLEPENYNAEKIKEIITLCKNYVSCLTLTEVRAPTKTDIPDHIPLNAILSDLSRLTELSLCFKQTYVGEKFSWHIFNTTMTDIKSLAKGLEQSKLQILRIQNSDINCVKVKMFLKALSRNDNLKELEFSHCKISDHGTMAVAKFAVEHPNLNSLILINNFIGANGAKNLAYALTLNCKLIKLNVRLNMIRSQGGQYLNRALIKGGRHLRNLIMAGCGLTNMNAEIGDMLRCNTILEEYDISNNRFGEEIGQKILKGLKYNKSLMHLDIRRCNFTSDTEWDILRMIKEHRNRGLDDISVSYREIDDGISDIFTEEFVEGFNSVFNM